MNDLTKILFGILVLDTITILVIAAYIKSLYMNIMEVISTYSKLSYEAIEKEHQELNDFREKHLSLLEVVRGFIENAEKEAAKNTKKKPKSKEKDEQT